MGIPDLRRQHVLSFIQHLSHSALKCLFEIAPSSWESSWSPVPRTGVRHCVLGESSCNFVQPASLTLPSTSTPYIQVAGAPCNLQGTGNLDPVSTAFYGRHESCSYPMRPAYVFVSTRMEGRQEPACQWQLALAVSDESFHAWISSPLAAGNPVGCLS